MSIDPERVQAVFMDALSNEGDPADDAIEVEGVVHTVALNRERLEGHRSEVTAMLAELPDEFHMGTGGGWTFLNACNDRHGEQWTGLHLRMEQLFQLGIGLSLAQSLMPREMWDVLPGGVPYYGLTLPAEQVAS